MLFNVVFGLRQADVARPAEVPSSALEVDLALEVEVILKPPCIFH